MSEEVTPVQPPAAEPIPLPRDAQQDAAIRGLAMTVQVLVQHLKKVESEIAEIKVQIAPKPRKPRRKKAELLQEQTSESLKE